MAVTIKKISELSGVSRGTVDRVLNGRGNVSPETETLVRRVAAELGYRPNLAGKALAARKKAFTIGVLLTAEGIPFFDDVIRGIREAETELSEYGVSVRLKTVKGYDSAHQVREMEAFGDISGLILNPIDDRVVADKVAELQDRGIPVATLNTDLARSRRLCYTGPDYRNSGETAGGMMSLLLQKERSRIRIFSGSRGILGHRQRVEGFTAALKARQPLWEIGEILYTEDDDVIGYEAATRALAADNGVDGIYVVAAGTYGVCRAVLGAKAAPLPVIVCSDTVPTTTQLMGEGVIQAAICQQPVLQGHQAVRRMFNYLLSGERPSDCIVRSEIVIRENLEAD